MPDFSDNFVPSVRDSNDEILATKFSLNLSQILTKTGVSVPSKLNKNLPARSKYQLPPPKLRKEKSTSKPLIQRTDMANLSYCEEPKLLGNLTVNFDQPSLEEIIKQNPKLKPGGYFSPPDCKPKHGPTAVIVAYRNREPQLRAFLHYIHPFLQRQLLEYVIIVVEQAGSSLFNRALLMNIGFKESKKFLPNGTQFQCYIFHDVDLLPENDNVLYTCSNTSIHLSGYMNKFNYSTPYGAYFGGVSAVPRHHFERANGFSNIFFGWGGEDDELHDRLMYLHLPIMRYKKDVLRYKMYKHEREAGNAANDNRNGLLRRTMSRMYQDGLNSLVYKLIKIEALPAYMHVLVDIDEDSVYKGVFRLNRRM